MSEWKECLLEDVSTLIGDGIHGTPTFDDNGTYFFINGNNLSQGHIIIKPDTKRVNSGQYGLYKKPLSDRTILLSINGTIGNVAKYAGEKCLLGKSACFINVKDEVEKDFVYYILCTPKFIYDIKNNANGSTIKNVSLKQIRQYPINLPPFSEQKKIAAILSSLDEKIETNRKINARLEELAQALFKSWFIDFEPFGGKMPEGWILKPIDEVYHIRYGKGLSKSQFINNGYPVYGANGIIGYINQPNVNQKVVLITSRGSGSGDVSYTYDDEAFITNNSFIVEPNPDYAYMGLPYIYQSFKKLDFKGLCSGSAQPQLTNLAISSLSIIVPNKDVVDKFTRITSTLYGLIFSIIKKSSRLAALRDALLPKLMSGELIPE